MKPSQQKLREALFAMRSSGLTAANWREAYPAFSKEVDLQSKDTNDRNEAKFRALLLLVAEAVADL